MTLQFSGRWIPVSKLYRAVDFPRMRGAMVKHLMSLDRQEAA